MVVTASMKVPKGAQSFASHHQWWLLASKATVESDGSFHFPSLCPGRWLVTLKAGARSVASKEIDVDGSAAAVEF
jgi:hypothetical protein